MLLQEFIRNVIVYREVLKPVLRYWKDSLAAFYYNEIVHDSSPWLNSATNRTRILGGGEEFGWDMSDEYEAMSLSKISGTLTITKHRVLSITEYKLFIEAKENLSSALSSKITCILLTHDEVVEKAVKIGKTFVQGNIPSIVCLNLGTSQTIISTTGHESKQINSFLFETHEKREYLGEFSLTHEETPLRYLLRGGEHHEIY